MIKIDVNTLKNKDLSKAVVFFIKNKTIDYISAGEILSGRAKNFTKWNKSLKKILTEELKNRQTTVFTVNFSSNKSLLIGIAIVKIINNGKIKNAILEDFIIDKSVRGIGLGKRFLKEMQNVLKKQGVNSIFLETSSKNLDAQIFFELNGYTQCTKIYEKKLK
jgi:ribosomal protein S18 acetylase RimI-like enzyme